MLRWFLLAATVAGLCASIWWAIYHQGSQAEHRKEVLAQHQGDVLVAKAQGALDSHVQVVYRTLEGKAKVVHDIAQNAERAVVAAGDIPGAPLDGASDAAWSRGIDSLRQQATRDAPSWALPDIAPGSPPSLPQDTASRAPD